MTWWNEDSRAADVVSPGLKARQRFDQIRRDSREVEPVNPEVGTRFRVRWPMSGWQTWRRVDATWCEFVNNAVG